MRDGRLWSLQPYPIEPAPLDSLLASLFVLVYVLVYAGALVAAALSINADLNTLLQIAWIDLLKAAPFATDRHDRCGS